MPFCSNSLKYSKWKEKCRTLLSDSNMQLPLSEKNQTRLPLEYSITLNPSANSKMHNCLYNSFPFLPKTASLFPDQLPTLSTTRHSTNWISKLHRLHSIPSSLAKRSWKSKVAKCTSSPTKGYKNSQVNGALNKSLSLPVPKVLKISSKFSRLRKSLARYSWKWIRSSWRKS